MLSVQPCSIKHRHGYHSTCCKPCIDALRHSPKTRHHATLGTASQTSPHEPGSNQFHNRFTAPVASCQPTDTGLHCAMQACWLMCSLLRSQQSWHHQLAAAHLHSMCWGQHRQRSVAALVQLRSIVAPWTACIRRSQRTATPAGRHLIYHQTCSTEIPGPRGNVLSACQHGHSCS